MSMTPLKWMLLEFRRVVINSSFIPGHHGIHEVISFYNVASKSVEGVTHPLLLVFLRQHLGHPECTQFFCTLTSLWIVSVETSGNMACKSLITKCLFTRSASSILWRSPGITDGILAPGFTINIGPIFKERLCNTSSH